MSTKENMKQIKKSLKNLESTGVYDVEKYTHSLLHQTSQLEYFYCHLVKEGNIDKTYYKVSHRPKSHELAYFNIGRGFPKELMDGHWCYVVKDLGYKMLVIPCTSIKEQTRNPEFEMDIEIIMGQELAQSRVQFSDIRSVDIQRLDMRKSFCQVITSRNEIVSFMHTVLL